ncbi:hypothetical protein VIGAN_05245600 [Vigna angularis var. angularis]|uniref:Uncharacterized protein n=1 Tax=Vigna angularis var. angularis TaxID=157739 RepID=A0A0S3S7M8_PHAAN|nr:hypothetical protein VIGAN_05245600 [Vigna angularis var. angularis]
MNLCHFHLSILFLPSLILPSIVLCIVKFYHFLNLPFSIHLLFHAIYLPSYYFNLVFTVCYFYCLSNLIFQCQTKNYKNNPPFVLKSKTEPHKLVLERRSRSHFLVIILHKFLYQICMTATVVSSSKLLERFSRVACCQRFSKQKMKWCSPSLDNLLHVLRCACCLDNDEKKREMKNNFINNGVERRIELEVWSVI